MITELALIIGLSTTHVYYDDHYNNDNKLVMVQVDNWTAGTMINSYNNRSFMAGYDFNVEFGGSRWGVMTGGVTGYDSDYTYIHDDGLEYTIEAMSDLPVMPMAAPYVRMPLSDHANVQINLLGTAFNLSAAITF